MDAGPHVANTVVVVGPEREGDLHSAVEKLAQAGGGTVFLLPGVYALRRGVNLSSNITIIGSGAGVTQFEPADPQTFNEPFFSVPANGATVHESITLRDFSIDGLLTPEEQQFPEPLCHDLKELGRLGAKQDRFGIYLCDRIAKGAFRHLRFCNLTIRRCAMGLHFLGASDVVVAGCRFELNSCVAEHFHNLYIRRSSDVLVTHVLLKDCSSSVGFNLGHSCSRVRFQYSTVLDNRFRGARFDGGEGQTTDIAIHHCIFQGNGTDPAQGALRITHVSRFEVVSCIFLGNIGPEVWARHAYSGQMYDCHHLDASGPRVHGVTPNAKRSRSNVAPPRLADWNLPTGFEISKVPSPGSLAGTIYQIRRRLRGQLRHLPGWLHRLMGKDTRPLRKK